MLRLVLGILKGGLLGLGLGFAAWKLGIEQGALSWPLFGLLGFLVGVVCGKPLWRQETLWTPVVKGIFGAAICMGLYWAATKTLGGFKVPGVTAWGLPDAPITSLPVLLAPAIGIIYGIFVEVDDGERKGAAPKEGTSKEPAKS